MSLGLYDPLIWPIFGLWPVTNFGDILEISLSHFRSKLGQIKILKTKNQESLDTIRGFPFLERMLLARLEHSLEVSGSVNHFFTYKYQCK